MTSGLGRPNLKDRLAAGARRLVGVFVYLWALLTLFALHESIVLEKPGFDYNDLALAVVNAWILAKVMLVAEELELGGHWFEDRPRIYRILSRAGLFAVVFMAARAVEGALLGLWHGKTMLESLPRIGGGPAGVLSVGVILSVALTPYLAFRELDRALGSGVLHSLLFARGSASAPRGEAAVDRGAEGPTR